MSTRSSLRIIGGNWRGRKISFEGASEIRPTPNRIRETLFNWLTGDLKDATCLELFAGSGILSIEALSRGAGSVTLVEKEAATLRECRRHLESLTTDQKWQLVCEDVFTWLSRPSPGSRFDIVFMDPPFDGVDPYRLCCALASAGTLAPRAFVYLESASRVRPESLPAGWAVYRQQRAASVHYCLCRAAR